MTFRFNLPIEVERSTGKLGTTTDVMVQIVCQGSKWRAQCQDPPVCTLWCDTMEEALTCAVKEMARDWAQATTA